MSRIEALDQKLGEDPPDWYPNAGNDQEVPPSLEVGVGGVEEHVRGGGGYAGDAVAGQEEDHTEIK